MSFIFTDNIFPVGWSRRSGNITTVSRHSAVNTSRKLAQTNYMPETPCSPAHPGAISPSQRGFFFFFGPFHWASPQSIKDKLWQCHEEASMLQTAGVLSSLNFKSTLFGPTQQLMLEKLVFSWIMGLILLVLSSKQHQCLLLSNIKRILWSDKNSFSNNNLITEIGL